jgi:hypothetical protein
MKSNLLIGLLKDFVHQLWNLPGEIIASKFSSGENDENSRKI